MAIMSGEQQEQGNRVSFLQDVAKHIEKDMAALATVFGAVGTGPPVKAYASGGTEEADRRRTLVLGG
eukprot:4044909-Lingulodinium_polyedra.AAC.1